MVGNRIGRITPAGTVTEFSSGITAGSNPDGYHGGAGRQPLVHRVQRQPHRPHHAGRRGHRVQHGITANSGPSGITAGPDGNLWFTEHDGNRIGRITPAGTVTEFSAASRPTAARRYRGGTGRQPLVHREPAAARIGRITPAGAVTEFSSGISAGSGPQGITAGPDGNLWFTEFGGNRIGRHGAATHGDRRLAEQRQRGRRHHDHRHRHRTSAPLPGETLVLAGGVRLPRSSAAARLSCTAQTLPHTAGTVDVTVTVNGGSSAPSAGDQFTYTTSTPLTTFTEFSTGITPAAGRTDITVGPDGNLWFTEPWAIASAASRPLE